MAQSSEFSERKLELGSTECTEKETMKNKAIQKSLSLIIAPRTAAAVINQRHFYRCCWRKKKKVKR